MLITASKAEAGTGIDWASPHTKARPGQAGAGCTSAPLPRRSPSRSSSVAAGSGLCRRRRRLVPSPPPRHPCLANHSCRSRTDTAGCTADPVHQTTSTAAGRHLTTRRPTPLRLSGRTCRQGGRAACRSRRSRRVSGDSGRTATSARCSRTCSGSTHCGSRRLGRSTPLTSMHRRLGQRPLTPTDPLRIRTGQWRVGR
jgi:hypothetical protein